MAASAVVPGQVDFQGLLLDDTGQPVNGVVDLDLTLFDALSAGNAVWTESHAGVSVSDGIYAVTLGAMVTLTPEVLAGGFLYLEITVEGETLTPRRPLLAVPYAVRADTAERVESVAGVAPAFIAQVFAHFDHDGNGLANSDAIEGLADVDLDGRANFIDPDNDGDGMDDAAEVAAGTDPNQITPQVTGFSPTRFDEDAVSVVVTIQGTNFDQPGLDVVFGSATPTPFNVTPTSFDVSVGSFPPGDAAVTVSLGNGESSAASYPVARVLRAFVTSGTFNGLLGGTAGADAICATAAFNAGVSGSYFAWIADSFSNPQDRLPAFSALTFRTVDDVPFATEALEAGPARDEFGNAATQTFARTGGGSVNPATEDCEDWTSQAIVLNGTLGDIGAGSPDWQVSAPAGFPDVRCSRFHPLYCFEQ
ncbi:MAG: IPT/TIG domain-containing protein [Myxococcota bacterium]